VSARSFMICKCLHVGRIAQQRDWAMPAHSHRQFWEMIVVLGGQLETQIAGQTLLGGAGDVLLYPRGAEHVERAYRSAALETIFVAWVPGADKEARSWPMKRADANGRMRMVAKWMYEARPMRHTHGMLDHLLAMLLHAYSSEGDDGENEMIGRVKRHVREHLASEIRLDDLASAACLSRFHFVRRFGEVAGMPPMRFVREARLDAARTLLLTTNLPHREIARRVGLGDQCQLARVFRRLAGYSPSHLRRAGS
jgi:AraC-like DNA-binding protein/mannose-6-phosphate isomerase-like protein (cupin superfamily)